MFTKSLTAGFLVFVCGFVLSELGAQQLAQDEPQQPPFTAETARLNERMALEESFQSSEDPPPDYVLGAGDVLSISVLGLEEISGHQIQIGTSGHIDLLLAGRVTAAGLTLEELKAELTRRLQHYMEDPQVVVNIIEFHSQPVSVIGAVGNPGVHQLAGRKTLIEVLSMAGGLRENAGYSVKITRRLENGRIPLPTAKDDPTGRFSIAEVDLPSVMEAEHPEHNILIQPHDVLSVPAGKMVYVIGGVQRAGAFVLAEKDKLTVLQAVSMANGLDESAAAGNAKILRASADSPIKEEHPVNLKKILAGKAPDVPMQADDILFIPNSKMKAITRLAIDNLTRLGTGLLIWRSR